MNGMQISLHESIAWATETELHTASTTASPTSQLPLQLNVIQLNKKLSMSQVTVAQIERHLQMTLLLLSIQKQSECALSQHLHNLDMT